MILSSNAVTKYEVQESREDVLRRLFQGKDVSRFVSVERLLGVKPNVRQVHDIDGHDRGYIVFNDVSLNRLIYISTMKVGKSAPFHEEKDIVAIFNVIGKNNDHSGYESMPPSLCEWWVNNMMYVVLQLMDTPGNVVLFCNHGRSRSPMYLVAYLIVVHGMLPKVARALVQSLLKEQRAQELDRFNCLLKIIEIIYSKL